jgi:hypothetical protein
VLTTPVDRIRCSLVGESRVPARDSSLSVLPSPFYWRVGVLIVTFEACSSFTRVTACRVAHPPYAGFIARLRPGRFPGSGARKLPSSTNNLLGWVLPPLVTCAVEAHNRNPHIIPDPDPPVQSRGQVARREPCPEVRKRDWCRLAGGRKWLDEFCGVQPGRNHGCVGRPYCARRPFRQPGAAELSLGEG